MTRVFSVAVVLSIWIASSPSVKSQGEYLYLEGNVDCGLWVKARTTKSSGGLEHYLLGLLNGMVLGSGIEFWRAGGVTVNRQQVYFWMDNYCRNDPLQTILTGSVRLMNERTNGAWDRQHSRTK